MTHVVTEACIRCLYLDCVQVCPVDCFHIGANMVVIHPDDCIDCGVCVPECPAEAIVGDMDDRAEDWLEHNRTYSEKWPNVVAPIERSPPPDADQWLGVPNKFRQFFDSQPGDPGDS